MDEVDKDDEPTEEEPMEPEPEAEEDEPEDRDEDVVSIGHLCVALQSLVQSRICIRFMYHDNYGRKLHLKRNVEALLLSWNQTMTKEM